MSSIHHRLLFGHVSGLYLVRRLVLRMVLGQLRHRLDRAATLGTGILVAAASFSLLTAASRTSAIDVRGAVSQNFRTSYDLLVRPLGSQSLLEQQRDLVRNNFETGITGGITTQQWQSVLAAPGVEVAAPVAYLGWVVNSVELKVPLAKYLRAAPGGVLRVRTTSVANGLSSYPGQTVYVYAPGKGAGCSDLFINTPPASGPFDAAARTYLLCLDSAALGQPSSPNARGTSEEVSVYAEFPLLIAAVDPVQENRLIHLDRAIVDGQQLSEMLTASESPLGSITPVIASVRTYVDDVLRVSIERMAIPPGRDPRAVLFDPKPDPRGVANKPYRTLQGLAASPLGTVTLPVGTTYGQLLDQLGGAGYPQIPSPVFSTYWTASSVDYYALGRVLRPRVVSNDQQTTWQDPVGLGGGSYASVPSDNADVQFRRVTPRIIRTNEIGAGRAALSLIGRYDIRKLPESNALNRVPLETYRPPRADPADARTSSLLHAQSLQPTANIGGYVAQPPTLLTTLKAAAGLLNPRYFSTPNLEPLPNYRAPISVIRVKVAGVTGPDQQSLARLKAAAKLIHDRTGLLVDVTAGSSPEPQTIQLPAGKFGQPALTVREGWTKKGVAVVILSALDRKSAGLFGLVLVVTVAFLGSGALATVRARREEIGVLLALGWRPRNIFSSVLAELAVIGLVAGLAGSLLATGLIAALHLDLPLVRVLLVPPVAVALAVAAGLAPAWTAARGRPIDVLAPAVARRGLRRRIRTLPVLALVNLSRRPGRVILAAATLSVSIAAVTVLAAITVAFQGTLTRSLLGDFVVVQIRGVDYLAAGLCVVLSAAAIADLLVLSLRERRVEIVTLKAAGWRDRDLGLLTVLEAGGIAGAGCVIGAVVGSIVGSTLGAPAPAVLRAALITVLGGAALTLAAATVPALIASRLEIAPHLAEE